MSSQGSTATPGLRWLTSPGRVAGVDLARGFAVLGMLTAHLLSIAPFDGADPSTWLDVVNGRSSILFAVLAGVSIGLLTAGAGGARLRVIRARLAVRAGAVWLLGVALISTGVPVYVILPAYAVLFLLSIPLLSLGPRPLWVIAAAVAVVSPLVQPLLDDALPWESPGGAETALLIGWHYPFTIWFAFVAAGLAVARSGFGPRAPLRLVLGGGAAALVAGVGAALIPDEALSDGWASRALAVAAHSGGLPEVIGSGGFALAVLGLCLALCRTPVATIVLPLRAVGAMPLTAYTGQILVWAVWAALALGTTSDLGAFRALNPLPAFVGGTILLSTVWAVAWGRGPCERIIAALASRLIPGAPRARD